MTKLNKIEKKCSICEDVKPLSDFGKNKTMKDGHRYECFECRRNKRTKIKKVVPQGFKKCGKCKNIKVISEFGVCIGTKTGLTSSCKSCLKEKHFIQYRKTHIIKIKEILPESQKRCCKCKEIKLKKDFHFSKQKKDELKSYCKKCRSEGCDRNNEKRRLYINEWTNEYNKKNPHKVAWRNLLKHTLERLGKSKEGKTIDLLGYSAIILKEHITSLFKNGMSWDNYGEWHIDHIKPVIKFDKETPVYIVNSLSNLQPLWATTRKINGVIYEGNLNKSDNY